MNKYISILIVSLFGCTVPQEKEIEVIESNPEILINVDKEFSSMSKENGMSEAFIFFADQDVVKLNQGQYPIIGKSKLTESFTSIDDARMSLTWEPMKAEMAKSGELGYTYGKYYFTTSDSVETTSTGYYFSVWKKQADGNWKYVLDGGAEGPIE
jgi:ketosteroid isomerase-like protein